MKHNTWQYMKVLQNITWQYIRIIPMPKCHRNNWNIGFDSVWFAITQFILTPTTLQWCSIYTLSLFRCVGAEDGEKMAREYSAIFMETSSKDGQNILDSLVLLAREMCSNEDVEVQTSTLLIRLLRTESIHAIFLCYSWNFYVFS